MDTSLLAGLIFFLVFAGMIFVHELGHFLVSRLLGIEVEEFGFGLPPRAWTFWRQKGYLLTRSGKRIEIPRDFGIPYGWSDVLNRNVTLTVDHEDDLRILRSIEYAEEVEQKQPSKPALSSGQVMVDQSGQVVRPPAEEQLVKQPVRYGTNRGMEELTEVIAETHPGTEFTLNWLPIGGFVRPKGENDPSVPGGLAAASPWRRLGVLVAGSSMNLLTAFIVLVWLVRVDGYHDFNRVQLAEISPNSPAEAAGMLAGDVIVLVAGQPVNSQETLSALIKSHLEEPVEFVLQRGDQTLSVTATPRSNPPEGQGAVGIRMGEFVLPVDTWGDTFYYAAVSVYDQVRALVLLPARLLRQTASPEEGRLVGFKGIYDIFNLSISTDMASREPSASTLDPQAPTFNTLMIIAALSISIGLINLFPFPALDGGRIIFVIPEMITRRRIPHQFENAVHAAGMIILLLFMLYINVMDFVNPLILPTP